MVEYFTMHEEEPFRLTPVDFDLPEIGSLGDRLESKFILPRHQPEELNTNPIYMKDYSKDEYIKPLEYDLSKYMTSPKMRLGSKEDEFSLNIIKLDRQHENLEKNDIYAPLMGKLSLNSIINDPATLVSKPNSLSNTMPSWLRQSSLQSPISYVELGTITPEDLPNLALPILEFIEDTQPHIIIGCDRGGRLFSIAIHAAWQNTRDGQPFPTVDGKIHFARVSKSEDEGVLQEKVDHIVANAKKQASQKGIELPDDEQLRVMFVDDWVIGSGTMRLAQRLVKKHGAKTYFAVMCGNKADATGQPDLHTNVSWHDRPEEIGVNYLSSLYELTDGTVNQRQEVIAVRGEEAIRNRKRIQSAAKSLQKVVELEKVA